MINTQVNCGTKRLSSGRKRRDVVQPSSARQPNLELESLPDDEIAKNFVYYPNASYPNLDQEEPIYHDTSSLGKQIFVGHGIKVNRFTDEPTDDDLPRQGFTDEN